MKDAYFFIFFCMLILAVPSCRNATSERQAWEASKELVGDHIISKKSAVFEKRKGKTINKLDGDTYEIFGNVDHQNAFGVIVSNQFCVRIKLNDGKWVITNGPFFGAINDDLSDSVVIEECNEFKRWVLDQTSNEKRGVMWLEWAEPFCDESTKKLDAIKKSHGSAVDKYTKETIDLIETIRGGVDAEKNWHKNFAIDDRVLGSLTSHVDLHMNYGGNIDLGTGWSFKVSSISAEIIDRDYDCVSLKFICQVEMNKRGDKDKISCEVNGTALRTYPGNYKISDFHISQEFEEALQKEKNRKTQPAPSVSLRDFADIEIPEEPSKNLNDEWNAFKDDKINQFTSEREWKIKGKTYDGTFKEFANGIVLVKYKDDQDTEKEARIAFASLNEDEKTNLLYYLQKNIIPVSKDIPIIFKGKKTKANIYIRTTGRGGLGIAIDSEKIIPLDGGMINERSDFKYSNGSRIMFSFTRKSDIEKLLEYRKTTKSGYFGEEPPHGTRWATIESALENMHE